MFVIVIVRYLVKDEEIAAQSYIEKPGYAYYMDNSVKTVPQYIPTGTVKMGLNPDNPFFSCLMYNRPVFAFVGSHELYGKLAEQLLGPSGSIF